MIVQFFGAIDLIAATLLYFGRIRGPAVIIGACIAVLLIKGIVSLYPIPLYIPGSLMNITDIIAALLLYFGETPLPELKIAAIFVLLVKSVPPLISGLFLVAGFLGSGKQ